MQCVTVCGVERGSEVGTDADRLQDPLPYDSFEGLAGDLLEQEAEQTEVGVAVLKRGTGVGLQHLTQRALGGLVPCLGAAAEEDSLRGTEARQMRHELSHRDVGDAWIGEGAIDPKLSGERLVELDRSLVDQLHDRNGREDLRDARDAEASVDRRSSRLEWVLHAECSGVQQLAVAQHSHPDSDVTDVDGGRSDHGVERITIERPRVLTNGRRWWQRGRGRGRRRGVGDGRRGRRRRSGARNRRRGCRRLRRGRLIDDGRKGCHRFGVGFVG